MLGKIWHLRRSKGGFTLVELMVVMAIMGILAAVVVPAVTGVSTAGHKTGQQSDLKEIANAVQRMGSEDTDGGQWPTSAATSFGGTAAAGAIPGEDITGSGTVIDPYVVDNDNISGIDWASSATLSDGTTKTFRPDYLKAKPRHASDTITLEADDSEAGGDDEETILAYNGSNSSAPVYVTLKNVDAVNPRTFPVWALDKNGTVWVFVNAANY